MDVVSTSPLRVASLIWQPRAGAYSLTVLCKATFVLTPGEAQLAPEQDPLTRADEPWGGDPSRSLRAASDIAPLKPRADVVLVGSAFAPSAVPSRSLIVRMVVGEIDKSMEVWCTRHRGLDGMIHESAPFVKVPLAYELAAGGPGTLNPVGVRADAMDAQGTVALPNLQPVMLGESIETIGFGPIAPHWPERAARLGPHAHEWDPVKWYRRPLPEGFELAYFNVAPADQQPFSLRGDEPIVLEHLHPDVPKLVTKLPGLLPSAMVEPLGGAPFALSLRADTLSIDTDRARCTLVYRGNFPLEHPMQKGRVVIELGPKQRSYVDASSTVVGGASRSEAPIPFAQGSAPPPRPSSPKSALPFGGASPLIPPPHPSRRDAPTEALPVFPDLAALAAPETAPLPITAPPPDAPPPEDHLTIGERLAAQASAPSEPERPLTGASGQQKPEMLGKPLITPTDPAAGAAAGGVLAASNAALGQTEPQVNWAPPRAAEIRAIPDDIEGTLLQIVWFDRDSVMWMRRRDDWKPILVELEKRPPDPAFDDPVLARDPGEVEDRREVFEILLRARAAGAEGLRAAMNEGMRPDGKFIHNLVMLAGDIEFPFDEVEELKAMIPTASWFTGADDPLQSALDGAIKFLATPGHPSGTVAQGYIDNIKKAFKQKKRDMSYLEGPAERTLLERRAYQRRPVLGGPHLRALFTAKGAKSAVPLYFPDAAARALPMYRRFSARVVAETHLPVDQYETYPAALKAAALGRIMPATRLA